MRANYKECDVIIGYQTIHLMPGQFIFGLNSASKDLRLSIQSLRTCLDYLKRSENITVQSTNKYSIITIVNWDTYQSVGDESNSQDNTIATNQQQTNNKPTTTDKKVKKVKNGKKIKKQNADALFVLPDWIPEETWAAYMALREKKRAAKTTYALNLIVKELIKIKETHNHDPVTVLNKSIKNGWIDVYPLKESDIVEQKKSKWFPDRPASGRMQ